MLRSLFIQNYALIEKLEVSFESKFTVITGKTGAGKSLIIGALSLLFGSKVDKELFLYNNKKCIVEGTFINNSKSLTKLFLRNGLDFEKETIIRREIYPSKKSRIFINDTPTRLAVVQKISQHLVDIHSQHKNLLLMNRFFQLNVIDNIAKNFSLKEQYDNQYSIYVKKQKELETVKNKYDYLKENILYYQHQLEEINAIKIQEGEQKSLETKQNQLANAEEIKSTLYNILQLINRNETSNIISNIHEVYSLLETIQGFIPSMQTLAERIESVKIELKDISAELEKMYENTTYDKTLLDEVAGRLNLLYTLQTKHKVDSISSLLELKNNWKEKIQKFQSYEEKITFLEKDVKHLEKNLQQLANKLSASRIKVFLNIESKIETLLKELGIPHAKFVISHTTNNDFGPTGKDTIQFKFSANKNVSLRPIEKVASGGEISRLMICLKYIHSNTKEQISIIFDEIDAGLSGKIAAKMGEIIQRIAQKQQIICITHLPQIASQGVEHLSVFKSEKSNKTIIQLKKLTKNERINIIAKLLSGKRVTETAINNAKELLGSKEDRKSTRLNSSH